MIIINIKGELSANTFYSAKSPWVRKEIVDRWHKGFNEAFMKMASEDGIAMVDIRYDEQVETLMLVPTSCKFDIDNLSAVEKLVIDCIKDQKVRVKKPGQKKGEMVLLRRGIIEDDTQKFLAGTAKRFEEEAPCIQFIISAYNKFDMEEDTATRIDVTIPPKPKTGKELKKKLSKQLEKKYSDFKNFGGSYAKQEKERAGGSKKKDTQRA